MVTGPGGSFILDLPMGIFTACLPTQDRWRDTAPPWAAELWGVLKSELEDWCRFNNAELTIEATAGVYPARPA